MSQRHAQPAGGNGGRSAISPARLCRRFRRDAAGATAVEFGLIALPFLAVLFAIIETALTFLTTQVVENAVEFASRQIYTGQFQSANQSTTDPGQLASKFKEQFCKKYIGLTPCSSVKIDVKSYTSNSFPPSVPGATTTNSSGQTVVDPEFGKYSNPNGNQIVIVRALVENPVFASLLNPNQANLSSGKRLVIGTAAFRTEPF